MNKLIWELHKVKLGTRLTIDNLQIHAGVSAILGPSGAGKSSLIDLLVGFTTADQGTITAHHRNQIAWAPQNAGLWPHMTIREHLDSTAPKGTNHTDELLELFELENLSHKRPAEISGGEASRVALARALASQRDCLVLDEPLAHVDREREDRIWQYLRQRVREGCHILFSSHNPERVLSEAQQVICLHQGKLIYQGEVDTLYHKAPTPQLANYLGPVNWLEEENNPCYRPEQLQLQTKEDGNFIVAEHRRCGSVIESSLTHTRNKSSRRVHHIPKEKLPKVGSTVQLIKLTLFMLLFSFFVSCDEDKVELLEFTSETHFNLPAAGKKIPAPRSVAMGKNNELYILDNAGRVVVTTFTGQVIRQWNMPESSVGNPEHIYRLSDGRLAVCDTHYHRIVLFNDHGKVLSLFGKHGKGPGEFIYPVALTEDDKGQLYVCEYGSNDRIQKFTAEGKYLDSFGTFGSGAQEFQRPSGIIWKQGQLFIADAINNRIQIFSDEGKYLSTMGNDWQLNFPYDLILDKEGFFWTVEYGGCRITRFSPEGKLLGRWGQAGEGRSGLRTPWALSVSPTGDVVITDTGNHRITVLTP